MLTHHDIGWDFAIYDRQNRWVAAVEVKNKLNASPNWATQLRCNLFARGTLPKVPYFLMVFPDRFYLWTGEAAQSDRSQPTYAIDATPIFDPYFKQAGVSDRHLSSLSLELIVASWLGELIYGDLLPNADRESQKWLLESGLYDAIAGGTFERGTML